MKSLMFTFVALAAFLWLSGSVREFLYPQKPYNVIFIHIDTLRADHLGLYGYPKNTSPNLDKFSQESLVFEQAISQAPWTLPSYASILTSQYPAAHGLMDREECFFSLYHPIYSSEGLVEGKGCLSPSKLTLAEVLQKHGYKTAAFVGDGDLKSLFGFAQGFDVYIDNGKFFDTTIPDAEEWISQNKKSRFFLYLQGYDVHTPYHKPEPYDHMFDETYEGVLADHTKFLFDDHDNSGGILGSIKKLDGKPYLVQDDGSKILLTQQDIDHIVAHYDGGIRYTDDLIQKFFDRLKEMGLYDNSIIVVFGDHGESIGDDLTRAEILTTRLIGHFKVYDELVRVPLLIKAPGLNPGRISSQVQLIDLFPTILDFLNISQNKEIREELQGRSLTPIIDGKEFESLTYGSIDQNGGHISFVRTLKWKLIREGENVFQLYDLENDPRETKNVIDEYTDVANFLEKNLIEWSFINLEKKAKTP